MPVRIGFVGAGEESRAMLETLQLVDEARVVAVCASDKTDIEYSLAETLARRIKAKAFRDVKAMLRDESVDAVCCVASGRARREAETLVLAAGCDLLLAPPLAPSVVKAQTLLQAATQSRSRLWISHHERFFASSEAARKILAARHNTTIACHGSWRSEKESAKTVNFLASSTRLIGLLRFLCGDVKNVYARSSASSLGLNIEFAGGALGAFVVGASCESRLRFVSQNQHLEWREQLTLLQRGNETQHIEYSNNAQREELRLWVQSVQSGRRTLQKSSAQDSLQTLRVALAIQQSAKTNKPVRIN